MKVFEFEVQSYISIKIEGRSAEEARLKLLNVINEYAPDMIKDCYISDGQEVKV